MPGVTGSAEKSQSMKGESQSALDLRFQPGDDLSADERWRLASRMAQSRPFHRAARLQAFLLFIVERTLRNRLEELSEYEIGVQVFQRPAHFNPADDSIVRSSARILRAKELEYFATEGRGEALQIQVPKGAYIPEF